MPIDYDLLDEGDALNAASLNSRVSSLQTGVNDLAKEDLGTRALRSEHLPSITRITDMTPGPSKIGPTPNIVSGTFTNYLGSPPSRNVIQIGPAAVAAQGYAVISSRTPVGIVTPGPFPGAATDCNITFSPSVTVVSSTTPATGFTDTTYCTGLLVRLNVAVVSKTLTLDPQDNQVPDSVVVGIVWEADGALGTYNFLEQSEAGARKFSTNTSMVDYSDLSTSALITADDTGGAAIARISGVISNLNYTGDLIIREWNMSIIPIFGGTL